MTEALDTLFVTGPVFEQLEPNEILVTPQGRPQTTLAQALADAAGSVVEVAAQAGPFLAQTTITAAGTIDNSVASLTAHGILTGQGTSPVAATAAMTGGQILVGQAGADPLPKTMSGDATLDNTGALGLVATGVAAGTYGDATHVGQFQVDLSGRLLTAANVLITGAAPTGPAGGDLGGNFPNPTVLSIANVTTGTLAVAHGGTGLGSGTSGGILGFTASGVLASSGALTLNALVLGGGAGATPTALGSLGSTTTVLHGNAAGAPSFAAVSLATDVSGVLPFANIATLAATSLFGNGAITPGTGGNIAIGSGLSLSVAGTLTATGSGGSVTSVNVSGGSTGLTASGGPITTSGTITLAGTLAAANGGTGATALSSMFAINSGTLGPSGATGIAATGSTQAGATTLTAWINILNASAANTGVRLINGSQPMIQRVINQDSVSKLVYPAGSGQINNGGASVPATIVANAVVDFSTVDGTLWVA